MATKFTKGGILNTTQLQNLSGKKWKKGGILNAKQLNELAGSGGSNKICVINERTVELVDADKGYAQIQIDNTNIPSGIFTAKLNSVEFPAVGEVLNKNGLQSFSIRIQANDEMGFPKPMDIFKIMWDSSYPNNTAEVRFSFAYDSWAIMYGGVDPEFFESENFDPSILPMPTVSLFVEPIQENEFLIIELVKEENEWKLKEDVSEVFTKLKSTAVSYGYRSVFKLKYALKDSNTTLYAYVGECLHSGVGIGGYSYNWHSSIYLPYNNFNTGTHLDIHLSIILPENESGEITYQLSVEEVSNITDADAPASE